MITDIYVYIQVYTVSFIIYWHCQYLYGNKVLLLLQQMLSNICKFAKIYRSPHKNGENYLKVIEVIAELIDWPHVSCCENKKKLLHYQYREYRINYSSTNILLPIQKCYWKKQRSSEIQKSLIFVGRNGWTYVRKEENTSVFAINIVNNFKKI